MQCDRSVACDFVLFKLIITGAALNFNFGDDFPAGWQAETTSTLSECLSGRNAVISGSKKNPDFLVAHVAGVQSPKSSCCEAVDMLLWFYSS